MCCRGNFRLYGVMLSAALVLLLNQAEGRVLEPVPQKKLGPLGRLRRHFSQRWTDFRVEGAAASRTFKHMIAFLWPRRDFKSKVIVCLSLVFLFGSKFLSVKMPFILQRAIDALNKPDIAMAALPSILFLYYGLFRIATVICQELKTTIFAYVAQGALRQYALTIFSQLHKLDSAFHQNNPTGLLSVAYVRGIRGFQTVMFQLVFSVAPTFLEVALVSNVLARRCGMPFVTITLLTFLIYSVFTAYITEWRVKIRRELVDVDNDRNAYFIDSIMNHESVKLYANEEFENARFDSYLTKILSAALRNTQSIAVLNVGQSLTFSTGLTIMMLMAAARVSQGAMSVGDLVAINSLLLQLSVPFNFIGYTYQELRQAFVDMDFMVNVLEKTPEIAQHLQEEVHDTEEAKKFENTRFKGDVEFKNVYFKYPNSTDMLLKDVSFRVPAGKTVALVGSSGSGKSTTLKLLTRLFDAASGSITVDGVDVKKLPSNILRKQIAVIPQDNILFDNTIEYNIQYGDINATEDRIQEAAKKARVHESVENMKNGYLTKVGERGAKLSGGERQRVLIARAILKNPSVLICDEVTSAVDAFTEKEIIDSLREVAENKTQLVIAHRLASIMDADQIVVMSRGVVVEVGTHKELLRIPNGFYARMWEIQQLEEETGSVMSMDSQGMFNHTAAARSWLDSFSQCEEDLRLSSQANLVVKNSTKTEVAHAQNFS